MLLFVLVTHGMANGVPTVSFLVRMNSLIDADTVINNSYLYLVKLNPNLSTENEVTLDELWKQTPKQTYRRI